MNDQIIKFIRNLFKKPLQEFIPLHEPRFIGNEKKYVNDAIDSTFVSSVGEYVNLFEEMMASIAGTQYAVATVNGTSALHIGLKVAGVEENTEVIMQAFTFVATANAISYLGAIPNIVDIESDALGIDPIKLKKYLNNICELRDGKPFNRITNRKISACVPMHTFGLVSFIDEIIAVCSDYNIPVIEDAAECMGSSLNGKPAGSFGLLGTFSFNGNKIVTCGGGGAIVTNDADLAKLAKHLTTTAKKPHPYKYFHDEIGYNFRMPNLNAALACAQLEMLPQFLEKKRKTFERYQKFFHSKSMKIFEERKNSKSNYWLNAIQFPSLKERDEFLIESNKAGVMTRPGWELMNTLPMFKDCPSDDISTAKFLQERIVNIPSSVINE